MSDQTTNALIAVALGTVVAIVLLIPTAAVQYRRDGRLGPGDLSILLSGAVYGLALWTYTLLPVPPAGEYSCSGKQLDPFGSIRLIWTGDRAGRWACCATRRSCRSCSTCCCSCRSATSSG